MKRITSLDLANEVIAKLVSMIEYEYEFAKFNRYEHAVKCANFDDENEQRDYLLWSCGRLEAMNKVKEKTDEIFIDVINDMIKTEGS
jgi:hypothetical protein